MDVLKDIDLTNKFINMAMTENLENNVNPLDHFYKMLKVKIERLESYHNDYKMIENMVKHCHGPTHNKFILKLQAAFKIEKFLEKERFFPFKSLPNRCKANFSK